MERPPSSRPSPETELRPRLDALKAQSLYRRRRLQDSPQQPQARVDGRPMLSFCGNDYLGLANDDRVREAVWPITPR